MFIRHVPHRRTTSIARVQLEFVRETARPARTQPVHRACVRLRVDSARRARSNPDMRSRCIALAVLSLLVTACGASRFGWARGRNIELRDTRTLQFRRGEMEVDPRTGDLVLRWVGVRAIDGTPDLLDVTFTIFDDVNANRMPEANEIVRQRTHTEPSRKVVFNDERLPKASLQRALSAQLVARTKDELRQTVWTLKPD